MFMKQMLKFNWIVVSDCDSYMRSQCYLLITYGNVEFHFSLFNTFAKTSKIQVFPPVIMGYSI